MFNHILTAQDVSICLRCQYRLNLRRKPRPGRRRCIGDPQQLRHFTPGASFLQQPSFARDSATDDDDLQIPPIRYSTEASRLDRNNGFQKELPKKDRLGLNVLGEPAEVLILRDRQKRFQLDSAMAKVRASGPDKNPNPETISSSEMLEKMDAERGTIDLKRVRQNIEGVRTSWAAEANGIITEDRVNDLVSRLQVGFTRPQLVDYLGKAVQNPATGVFDLTRRIHSTFYARSSWQPLGTASPGKSRAPRLVGLSEAKVVKETGQGLSKDALAKMIVWQCWSIRTISEESSQGELDIRLQRSHLSLILNHSKQLASSRLRFSNADRAGRKGYIEVDVQEL